MVEEDRIREIFREEFERALSSVGKTNSRDILTVKEAAEYLGIGITKCYDLTRRRGFPAHREGNRIIIPREALKKWVENEAVTNSGNPTGNATRHRSAVRNGRQTNRPTG